MQMNDAPFMTTDDKLSAALQNLNFVKGGIFDLRTPRILNTMICLGMVNTLTGSLPGLKGFI